MSDLYLTQLVGGVDGQYCQHIYSVFVTTYSVQWNNKVRSKNNCSIRVLSFFIMVVLKVEKMVTLLTISEFEFQLYQNTKWLRNIFNLSHPFCQFLYCAVCRYYIILYSFVHLMARFKLCIQLREQFMISAIRGFILSYLKSGHLVSLVLNFIDWLVETMWTLLSMTSSKMDCLWWYEDQYEW